MQYSYSLFIYLFASPKNLELEKKIYLTPITTWADEEIWFSETIMSANTLTKIFHRLRAIKEIANIV